MKLIDLLVPLSLAAQVLSGPTPIKRRSTPRHGFAYTDDGQFKLDGNLFHFGSTNAYWLTQLNTEADITKVLVDVKAQGSTVVRAWCFREVVGARPSNPATYTAVWQNGKQILNKPGLDRIQFILDQADSLGLKVQCALTNNWAPTYPADAPRPLGYYSNSYGGVDTYVRELKPGGHHDDFFTDATIKAQYKVFLRSIVNTFKDSSALFGWELINDAQCGGATGTTTSGNCKTTTITSWVNELAAFVKSIDPDHLLAAGDHGFYCIIPSKCPKINPVKKRSVQKVEGRRGLYLTVDDLEHQSTNERRAGSIGASFDGSAGIDTEDILNSPNVDYNSFQFFPDQATYGNNAADSVAGPPRGGAGGPNFATTLEQGLNWVNLHAASGRTFGKPSCLTGYGWVSQDSSTDFEPFSSTSLGPTPSPKRQTPMTQYATDLQKQQAIQTMTTNAANNGLGGVGAYQEGTSGLHSVPNTIVDNANNSGDSSAQAGVNGGSPNDGYSNNEPGTKTAITNSNAVLNALNG